METRPHFSFPQFTPFLWKLEELYCKSLLPELTTSVVVGKVYDRNKIGINLDSHQCLSWVQIQIYCVGGDKE